MDLEGLDSPEPAKPQLVDIVIELPSVNPASKREFALVDDIDDGDDINEAYESSRVKKRKLDDDDDYSDQDDEQVDDRQEQRSLQGDQFYGGGRPNRKIKLVSNTSSTTGRQSRHASRVASTDHEEDTQMLDDDDELSMIADRPSKRLRPRREATLRTSGYGLSQTAEVDELAQDDVDADGDFFLVQSDLQPARKPKRKKRLTRGTQPRKAQQDDAIEFEAPRRSDRSNRHKGAMYEMADNHDEESFYIEDDDDKPSAAPRILSVKEIFKPVETDFKRVHSPICNTCDLGVNPNKGAFVYCQGCSYSYHKSCLGLRSQREHLVTKVGDDSFVLQCRFCINIFRKKDRRAPDLTMCQTCRKPGKSCHPFSTKKTAKQEEQLREQNGGQDPVHQVAPGLVNSSENVLFRCLTCQRAFHQEHVPRFDGASDDPDTIKVTSDTVRTKTTLKEYSVEWKCKDCIEIPAKPDTIVAWRPKDARSYDPETTPITDYTEDEVEYLVKWDKMSHRHCTWMPGAWAYGALHAAMRGSYLKRVVAEGIQAQLETSTAIPEEYITMDVILLVKYKPGFTKSNKAFDLQNAHMVDKVFTKFIGLGYDDAVWDQPPSPEDGALYKAFMEAYDEFLTGVYFQDDTKANMTKRLEEYHKLDFARDLERNEQPASLQNGTLMKYQISGVNWLKYNFHKKHNAILADEMGLGKTVQIVAMVADLVLDQPRVWPFLVVVPNATVPNWRREVKKWAPDLRVVTYHGGRIPQDLAAQYELFPRGSTSIKAHVVVMSYEAAADTGTKHRFRQVQFAGLVVDEGHRLKNDKNLLYAALMDMKIPFKVLLTGTPLQNNKRELFNLLQFLDPKVDAVKMDEEYNELTVENIPKLHDLIRPFFLRRTKADTLLFLPKMARVIIPVTMTVLQKEFSKRIMAKNPALLQSLMTKDALNKGDRASLNNILMQLRKVLCHPFIYSSNVEDKTVDPVTLHNNMVEASSKLMLLQIMLPKLKERGHRVLLFSQFLDQLDIMEDFLAGIGLSYSRIDGKISSMEKQRRIDAFNAEDSTLFAMLLSTRAGGVGINLATADTVIVLDPDFNPHQDLQALSRSHRIGQKKPVLCFTITTKDSVEEKIMQAGRKKMALDHALIEAIDKTDEETADLVSILKHGAELLFGEGKRDSIVYDSASVDKLLDRERLIAEQNPPKDDGEDGKKPKAAFGLARVWDNNTGHAGEVNADDGVEEEPVINHSAWEEILRVREEEARREEEANREVLGRGGRRRGKAVKYSGHRSEGEDAPGDAMQLDDASGYDTDFRDGGSANESDAESDAVGVIDSDTENVSGRAKKARAKTPSSQGKASSKPSPSTVTPKKRAVTPKKAAASAKKAKTVTPRKAKSVTPKKSIGKAATARKSATPSKSVTPGKKTSVNKASLKKPVNPKAAPPSNKLQSAVQAKKQDQRPTKIDKTQSEKPTPSKPNPDDPKQVVGMLPTTPQSSQANQPVPSNEDDRQSSPQPVLQDPTRQPPPTDLPHKPPMPLPSRPLPPQPRPLYPSHQPIPRPAYLDQIVTQPQPYPGMHSTYDLPNYGSPGQSHPGPSYMSPYHPPMFNQQGQELQTIDPQLLSMPIGSMFHPHQPSPSTYQAQQHGLHQGHYQVQQYVHQAAHQSPHLLPAQHLPPVRTPLELDHFPKQQDDHHWPPHSHPQ